MTKDLMTGTIKFDRPFDMKKHKVRPYILCVKLKGMKEAISFDFEEYETEIDKDNENLLHFSMSVLDFCNYPESKYLLTHLDNIESFQRFFILIEDENGMEEIVPLNIESLCISFNDNKNVRAFNKHFVEQIPLDFNGGLHTYGIYDLQQGFLREEEYASYQSALVNFGESLLERIVEEEDEEYKASTATLTLHEAFSAAGYSIVEKFDDYSGFE